MTDLIKAENNLPTDLISLTAEIKFYVNQWGQNTIEIGKRLIVAKKLVAKGEWQNWLKENFNLKMRSAQNFMAIAERFGKTQTFAFLNYSQMIQMLALPKGEEEKFIAEKATEGTPLEEMTVNKLREEVEKYKADYERKKSEVENLFSEIKGYKEKISEAEVDRDGAKAALKVANEESIKLCDENAKLQEQLQNQEPQVVEKIPDDYTNTNLDLSAALSKVDDFFPV